VDLRSRLATLGLGEDDFSYFLEVSSVRFWFHTPDAKRAILDLCSRLEHGTLLSHTDMRDYGIPLKDESYGEAFFFLDPGHIFFPHDFHHPLANLWLGISDPMQRSRLRDPRHRGNHGHLPHFAAENAFLLLLNDRLAPATEGGHVLDVAPSTLGAMGLDPPSTMTGRALFLPPA
jgi:hypothetical protein